MNRDVPAVVPPDVRAQARASSGEWALKLPFVIPLSLNDRDHWAVAMKKKKVWREAATVLARAARIPACSRIQVELHYVPATDRRRDQDNLVASMKPLVDGIVDAGVVPDDTEVYVERVWPIIHPFVPVLGCRDDPRLVLRVIAL